MGRLCSGRWGKSILSLHAHHGAQFVDDLDQIFLRVHHRVDLLVRRRAFFEHALVDRCTRRMRSHGWAMVRGCADMDIDAARSLERMQ